MRILLAISFFALSTTSFAAENPWLGSWGQASGPNLGALVLKNCSGERCEFLLHSIQDKSGCSYTGRAEIKGDSAKLIPSGGFVGEAFEPNIYHCELKATRQKEQIFVGALPKECEAYCTGNPVHFVKSFTRVSKAPFNDTDKCFTDKSPAREAWCTDAAFLAKDKELLDLQIKAEAADPAASEKFKGNFSEIAIAACAKEKSPSGCLREKYSAYFGQVQITLKAAEAQEKEFKRKASAPGSEPKADALITEIDGVYKSKFSNGLVDGSSYQSENILELVRVSKSAVYFKIHTEFYNGHQCNLNGLAKYSELGAFVYQGEGCTFLISADKKDILLDDHAGTCKDACGARGSLMNEKFARAKRRPIKYMEKLKASADYKQAVK